MPVRMFRRHASNCQKIALLAKKLGHEPSQKEKDEVKNCECGIHIQGTIGGNFVRKGLKTPDWTEASNMLLAMEAEARFIPNKNAMTFG
jgi:hypothetical protein